MYIIYYTHVMCICIYTGGKEARGAEQDYSHRQEHTIQHGGQRAARLVRPIRRTRAPWYSDYLLYWYKSADTDALEGPSSAAQQDYGARPIRGHV